MPSVNPRVLSSERSRQGRERRDCWSRGCSEGAAGWGDGRKRAVSQGMRAALEAGGGKGTDFPLEPSKEMQSC